MGLKKRFVRIKEARKPTNIPIYPKYFNNKIESKIPIMPCPIETKVGTLFNLSADKKTTETLSKITKIVKNKKSLNKSTKDGSFRPLQ